MRIGASFRKINVLSKPLRADLNLHSLIIVVQLVDVLRVHIMQDNNSIVNNNCICAHFLSTVSDISLTFYRLDF